MLFWVLAVVLVGPLEPILLALVVVVLRLAGVQDPLLARMAVVLLLILMLLVLAPSSVLVLASRLT